MDVSTRHHPATGVDSGRTFDEHLVPTVFGETAFGQLAAQRESLSGDQNCLDAFW